VPQKHYLPASWRGRSATGFICKFRCSPKYLRLLLWPLMTSKAEAEGVFLSRQCVLSNLRTIGSNILSFSIRQVLIYQQIDKHMQSNTEHSSYKLVTIINTNGTTNWLLLVIIWDIKNQIQIIFLFLITVTVKS